jgi:hypothetical protein
LVLIVKPFAGCELHDPTGSNQSSPSQGPQLFNGCLCSREIADAMEILPFFFQYFYLSERDRLLLRSDLLSDRYDYCLRPNGELFATSHHRPGETFCRQK